MNFSRSVGLPFSHTVTVENLQDIPLPDLNIFRQVIYGQSKCCDILFNKIKKKFKEVY